MIIIPGIAKSGTSYLTKKIHETGVTMYKECDKHYEDIYIANLMKGWLVSRFGYDRWHTDKIYGRFSIRHFVIPGLKGIIEMHGLRGFKNPRLMHVMPELIEAFPEAKFVICIRRLEAFLQSNKYVGKKGYPWRAKLTAHWMHCLKIVDEFKNNKNVFIFNYDDGDWEGHQKSLNDFLGFNIDMSDFKPKLYE